MDLHRTSCGSRSTRSALIGGRMYLETRIGARKSGRRRSARDVLVRTRPPMSARLAHRAGQAWFSGLSASAISVGGHRYADGYRSSCARAPPCTRSKSSSTAPPSPSMTSRTRLYRPAHSRRRNGSWHTGQFDRGNASRRVRQHRHPRAPGDRRWRRAADWAAPGAPRGMRRAQQRCGVHVHAAVRGYARAELGDGCGAFVVRAGGRCPDGAVQRCGYRWA